MQNNQNKEKKNDKLNSPMIKMVKLSDAKTTYKVALFEVEKADKLLKPKNHLQTSAKSKKADKVKKKKGKPSTNVFFFFV